MRARAAGPVVERVEQSRRPAFHVVTDPFVCAARLLTDAVSKSLEKNATVRLAIPGGSALEVVPQVCRDLGDDWGRVALTWVDERCVPFEDPESNRGAAARLGLFGSAGRAALVCNPVNVLPLFKNGETPDGARLRVAQEFSELFSNGIDVALLGMGADGHVASLFPRATQWGDQMVAHIEDSPKPPSDRITLTHRALATASVVVLVATGEAKRDALSRLAIGDPTLPAQGLSGLVVVTDLDLGLREPDQRNKGDSK